MNSGRFNIMTLQDNYRLGDPVTIITAGVGILSSLFPNIFGGNRKRLTDADWLQLFPGSGYWTSALRNDLKTHIHYDVDFPGNVSDFTKYFVDRKRSDIIPSLPAYPATITGEQYQQAYKTFLEYLALEKQTGGNSPVGQVPGGYGQTVDWSKFIPIAIGGIVLIVAMKNKKGSRK